MNFFAGNFLFFFFAVEFPFDARWGQVVINAEVSVFNELLAMNFLITVIISQELIKAVEASFNRQIEASHRVNGKNDDTRCVKCSKQR